MYQKTNAVSEIKRFGKDSFWAKAEVSAASATMAGVCGAPSVRQAWSKHAPLCQFPHNQLLESPLGADSECGQGLGELEGRGTKGKRL